MEKQLFQEHPEKRRVEMLADNCDAIEEIDYTEVLSDQEMSEKKDLLAVRSIEESRIMDEKKEAMATFKEKLAPIISEKADLLEEIKHRSRSVFGKVYKIIEGDRVGYYCEKGNQILERSARPDERQLTIASIRREGTNNV